MSKNSKFDELQTPEEKKLIKRKISWAIFKSVVFSFTILTIFFNIYCPKLFWNLGFIPVFLFCFIFCHNAVFVLWFGRGLSKYIEGGMDDRDGFQLTRDHINTANGYPPGLGHIVPRSSIRG